MELAVWFPTSTILNDGTLFPSFLKEEISFFISDLISEETLIPSIILFFYF